MECLGQLGRSAASDPMIAHAEVLIILTECGYGKHRFGARPV